MMRALFILLFVACLTVPAFADFDAGKKAYDAKNWRAAILSLRPLAEGGNDRALILLGNMYANGYGVASDDEEAFALYQRAAILGNTEAMMVTALFAQEGRGIATDVRRADFWYERAGAAGDAPGAFLHAVNLYQGRHGDAGEIAPDHPKSYEWFRIAEKTADGKLKDAAANFAAKLGAEIKPEEKEKADKAAAGFKPQAAKDLPPVPDAYR